MKKDNANRVAQSLDKLDLAHENLKQHSKRADGIGGNGCGLRMGRAIK